MRAAVLYPWPDILARRTGASMRVGLLIDYLRPRCEQLTVLSAGESTETVRDGVRYRFVRQAAGSAPWQVARRRLARSGGPRRLHALVDPAEIEALDFFYRSRYQELRAAVDEAVAGSDVVFLEYPFWASFAIPACREHGAVSVLTLHDVLSRTWGRTAAGRRLIAGHELRAMRAADHPCCVSAEDQRVFREHGVTAACVPNPIDVSACLPEPRADRGDRLRSERRLRPGPVCLFFGSNHPPNRAAAEAVRQMAGAVPEASFVIAGTCAPPGRDGNVVSLGEVSDGDRRTLYTLADIVLIPLQHGTGSSLKLIEALAYGKPVLTSTVGARGYPVENGVQAIVADHLPAYPNLIRALVRNEERRLELGARAREFSWRFDYRRAFEPYARILSDARAAVAA